MFTDIKILEAGEFLKFILDDGIITQVEFKAKKEQLLGI